MINYIWCTFHFWLKRSFKTALTFNNRWLNSIKIKFSDCQGEKKVGGKVLVGMKSSNSHTWQQIREASLHISRSMPSQAVSFVLINHNLLKWGQELCQRLTLCRNVKKALASTNSAKKKANKPQKKSKLSELIILSLGSTHGSSISPTKYRIRIVRMV